MTTGVSDRIGLHANIFDLFLTFYPEKSLAEVFGTSDDLLIKASSDVWFHKTIYQYNWVIFRSYIAEEPCLVLFKNRASLIP